MEVTFFIKKTIFKTEVFTTTILFYLVIFLHSELKLYPLFSKNKISQQEFEALFNNAAIGIVTTDHDGNIIHINNFALKQFGYEQSELLGAKIETLIPKRFAKKHVHHRDHYHDSNAHSRPMGVGLDLFAVRKDNTEFPVEVSLSGYTIDDKQYAIAFVSDITIRKRSEEALLKLNAQLEEIVKERTESLSETVAKLEVQIKEAEAKDIQLRKALENEKELNELKSRFVSLASHEFRTPLSTVLSSAYLVTKYTSEEDQPKRERHIERIVSSVNMLTDILNDFLSVGKIEEGKIQVRLTDFNIEDLIKSLISELTFIRKTGQKINYKHKGEAIVWLDNSLLKHIMTNLISNAIKFSPENSPIDITSSNSAQQITIAVKDYGMGISKEDQEHLFERFFRGANVTNIQGTGLGLHIIGKYTELMNGNIDIKSELEKGTEFTITFNKKTTNNENNTTY